MTGLTPILQTPATGTVNGYGTRRDEPAADPRGAASDAVVISSTAQRAVEAAGYVERGTGDDVREELVARAQENLKEGTYRLQEAVLQVAARIGNLLN